MSSVFVPANTVTTPSDHTVQVEVWFAMAVGLGLILLAVLLGPVLVKPVEEDIELFFLVAGTLASLTTGEWGKELLPSAVAEPLALTIAVLVFGVIARF